MDPRLSQAIGALGTGGYTPGSSATAGDIYNPLPFPGCAHIPCHRPNTPERWAMISKSTDFAGRSILDLGCATGYFSFKSIQANASGTYSIDHDPKAIAVCQAAQDVFNVKGTNFIVGTELATPYDRHFDIGFAMTVLNWAGRDRAERWLQWASDHVSTLWIEMPIKGDGRSGAKWLHSHADIVKWLKKVTTYSSVGKAGQTQGPHSGQWRALIKCQ